VAPGLLDLEPDPDPGPADARLLPVELVDLAQQVGSQLQRRRTAVVGRAGLLEGWREPSLGAPGCSSTTGVVTRCWSAPSTRIGPRTVSGSVSATTS
jgi:hypothetical protein